jgi:hypothetical protein
VSLAGRVNVPVGELFGWSAATGAVSTEARTAVLHGVWSARLEGRASGRLMPLGSGWGLLVTRLRWPTTPLAA